MSVRAGNAIALARGMVMAGGEDEAEDDGQGEQEMGCSAVQCSAFFLAVTIAIVHRTRTRAGFARLIYSCCWPSIITIIILLRGECMYVSCAFSFRIVDGADGGMGRRGGQAQQERGGSYDDQGDDDHHHLLLLHLHLRLVHRPVGISPLLFSSFPLCLASDGTPHACHISLCSLSMPSQSHHHHHYQLPSPSQSSIHVSAAAAPLSLVLLWFLFLHCFSCLMKAGSF